MFIHTKILSTSVLSSIKPIVSLSRVNTVKVVAVDQEVLHCSLLTCVSTVFGGFTPQGLLLGANHIVDARGVEYSAEHEIDRVLDSLGKRGCATPFLLGVFGGIVTDPYRGYNLDVTLDHLQKRQFEPYINIRQTAALGVGFYFNIYSLMPNIFSVSIRPARDKKSRLKPAFELEPIFASDLRAWQRKQPSPKAQLQI